MSFFYSSNKNFLKFLSILSYFSFSILVNSAIIAQEESAIQNLNSNLDNISTLKENAQKLSDVNLEKSKSTPAAQIDVPQESKIPPKPGSLLDRFFGRTIGVQIQIQKDSNENTAILTELIIIYKPELYAKIASLSMRQWFSNSPEIKNLRESPDIAIARLELTPETLYSQYFMKVKSSAVGGLLFTRLQNNLDTYPPYINPYENLNLNFFYNGFDFKQNLEK
ncbi:hypothetical protein [Fluviispira sanaruensis]|uniref:Uncharacterized protein n=1 Tax=Fluviispira sanaruensis TaxID=2493639 RepID=A0A4P2VUE5_FLUSA|nr:hypothetical protein [Fluviispira sanaruensis]BBH52472.1 hypothetical protein JCM31447_09130 [Fluviispira sanaruensis]